MKVCIPGSGTQQEEIFRSEEGFNCLFRAPASQGTAELNETKAKFGGEVTIRFHSGTINGLGTSLVPHAIRAFRKGPTPKGGGFAETDEVRLEPKTALCGEEVREFDECKYEIVPTGGNFEEGYYLVPVYYWVAALTELSGQYDLQLFIGEHAPPTARFTVEHVGGLEYKFDGSSSIAEGSIFGYTWLIDNVEVQENNPFEVYHFPAPGTYTVGLAVEDSYHQHGLTEQKLVVPEPGPTTSTPGKTPVIPPVPTNTSPASPKGTVGKPAVRYEDIEIPASCTAGVCTYATDIFVAVPVSGKASVAKARTKLVLVGARTVTLTAGEHQTVKLTLNAAGKRLLRSRHKLAVTLRVTQLFGGGRSQQVLSKALLLSSRGRAGH